MVLKVYYSFLIFFLIPFFFTAPSSMDKETFGILIVLVLISVLLFFLRKERRNDLQKKYLKHSTLALIGLLIVFFQCPIDFVFGNISASDTNIWVNQHIALKSFILSIIGLHCFLLGYLFYNKDQRTKRKAILRSKPVKVGIFNFLAAFCLGIYFFTVNPLYLAGYYGIVPLGTSATYASIFFYVFTFASVIQKSRNMLWEKDIPKSFLDFLKKSDKSIIILILIYFLSVIVSGDRGPLIEFSILFVGSYFFLTKKKVSIYIILGLLFLAAFIITFLGVLRGEEKNVNFSQKFLTGINQIDKVKYKTFSPETATLAMSISTLNTTVDYIPTKHDFLYGRFLFQKIIGTIPFISNFFPLLFKDNSFKFEGSASFITWIYQGDHPYSGLGTSVIADFYFDFGIFGVIAGMLLFGGLMRFAELKMYSKEVPNLFAHVFLIVYLSIAIYIARDTLFSYFKIVCWIYIVLIINQKINNYKVPRIAKK